MQLTEDLIKYVTDDLNTNQSRTAREDAYERYLMYEGKSLDVVKSYFRKEFKKQETIEELDSRIVPLNITQKIIKKLSSVYIETPYRYALDGNEGDNELVQDYETALMLNTRMKEANRHFKQFKTALLELFIDKKGCPAIRALPRHTYKTYALNTSRPEIPNIFAKILVDDHDPSKQVISITTDESHVVADGHGKIIEKIMIEELKNPNGINPYGKAPFVYINESSHTVNPLIEDDLHRYAIAIAIILSDINVAIKYQAWSVIYTVGLDADVPFSPNSIISADFGPNGEVPQVNTVKPEIDTDKIINLVTNLITLLLSTKNLSASTIQSTDNLNDAASGVSKAIDSAETIEDVKDQWHYFLNAEYDIWNLLSEYMIPFWRQKGLLKTDLNKAFSEAFEVGVVFKEPKVILSETEKISNQKMLMDNNFTTLKRALRQLNPDMVEDELDELELEIVAEEKARELTDVRELNGEVESEV